MSSLDLPVSLNGGGGTGRNSGDELDTGLLGLLRRDAGDSGGCRLNPDPDEGLNEDAEVGRKCWSEETGLSRSSE